MRANEFLATAIGALLALCVGTNISLAQAKIDKTRHISFKDSLDGAFDLSDWIIDYNGFIPVPAIITESALGGFGGALVPVFIKQQKPRVINGKVYPMAPDVTAAFGGYTLNDSWAVGAGRVASIPKWGVKYKLMGGYASINMDYYKTLHLPQGDVEKEFGLNIRTIPVAAYIGKLFKNPRWIVGVQYLFAHSDVSLQAHTDNQYIDSLISSKDYNSNIAWLGLLGEYDTRDNTFTPNRGVKAYLNTMWNSSVWGSDYSYLQMEGAFYWFKPINTRWISGFRFDMQQVFGDIPFYIKPFLDMRGVPAVRYQGKTTMLAEAEQRFDVYKRWSLVALGGTGKAFDNFNDFSKATWVYNYGGGFRYLIARKLGLRMGVDVAKSNDSWGYYLIFGSGWLRQ